MDGQLSKETREWLSEVLPEVLRDEDVILRLVERGLLWLEWNPTDKNSLVWMSKRGEGDRFAILKGSLARAPTPASQPTAARARRTHGRRPQAV
jgi:hypothetical protein